MVKLRRTLKYFLIDSAKSVSMYLGICLLVLFFFIILKNVMHIESISYSMDSSHIIFSFVFGLVSFIIHFKFFLQSGLSRKILLITYGIGMAIISLTIAFLHSALSIFQQVGGIYTSSFYIIYGNMGERYLHASGAQIFIEQLLSSFAVFLLSGFLGILLCAALARMSKMQKMLLLFGSIALTVILPIINFALLDGKLGDAIIHFFQFISGALNGMNPYYLVISSFIMSSIIGAFTWLIVRRMPQQ